MIECVTFRVLVKPHDVTETDEAYKAAKRLGLDLSLETKLNREQAATDKGIVVSWGPTAFADYNVPNPLTKGDEVVYAKHAGKEVVDPETKEKFVILNDEDIVAILRSNGEILKNGAEDGRK